MSYFGKPSALALRRKRGGMRNHARRAVASRCDHFDMMVSGCRRHSDR